MPTTTLSAEEHANQNAVLNLASHRLQYRLSNSHRPKPIQGEGRHYVGYVDGLAASFDYVGQHRAEELAVSA